MKVVELSRVQYPSFIKTYHEVFFHKTITAVEMGERKIFVHAREQDIMSFIVLKLVDNEGEVLDLGVLPVARRQGLAGELLCRGLAWARQRGAKNFFLEVSAGNAAAITLYEKFGFVVTGRRKRYYPDGSDALTFSHTPSI